MKYTFYLQNGTAVDSLPEGYTGFYIAEDIESDSELSRYFYPGDKIQYSLDSLCVDLYDIFQDSIFPSRDEFYKNYGDQPQWISRAGLDSDFDMDKDQLVECFSTPIHERMLALGVEDKELLKIYQEIEGKKYRYAYVADCQSLVNTLQALIIGCHSSLIGFYKQLCSLRNDPDMDGDYYQCGPGAHMVHSFLHQFIIQAYSIFDMLTKIAYELEHIKVCESAYEKLASRQILYGSKKKLKIGKQGTVFESCRTTSIIENLRNELVHNATWEMNPKVFFATDAGKVTERCIYLPDFTAEGTPVTFNNRKRFFADGKKVNEELPALYFDLMQRVSTTLNKLQTIWG